MSEIIGKSIAWYYWYHKFFADYIDEMRNWEEIPEGWMITAVEAVSKKVERQLKFLDGCQQCIATKVQQ